VLTSSMPYGGTVPRCSAPSTPTSTRREVGPTWPTTALSGPPSSTVLATQVTAGSFDDHRPTIWSRGTEYAWSASPPRRPPPTVSTSPSLSRQASPP
jgi:hypothetical protein